MLHNFDVLNIVDMAKLTSDDFVVRDITWAGSGAKLIMNNVEQFVKYERLDLNIIGNLIGYQVNVPLGNLDTANIIALLNDSFGINLRTNDFEITPVVGTKHLLKALSDSPIWTGEIMLELTAIADMDIITLVPGPTSWSSKEYDRPNPFEPIRIGPLMQMDAGVQHYRPIGISFATNPREQVVEGFKTRPFSIAMTVPAHMADTELKALSTFSKYVGNVVEVAKTRVFLNPLDIMSFVGDRHILAVYTVPSGKMLVYQPIDNNPWLTRGKYLPAVMDLISDIDITKYEVDVQSRLYAAAGDDILNAILSGTVTKSANDSGTTIFTVDANTLDIINTFLISNRLPEKTSNVISISNLESASEYLDSLVEVNVSYQRITHPKFKYTLCLDLYAHEGFNVQHSHLGGKVYIGLNSKG